MATVTAVRDGLRWLILPAYSVVITDPTGTIIWRGYGRAEARALAKTLRPIVGSRPIGALADLLAKELTLREPKPGEEWTYHF